MLAKELRQRLVKLQQALLRCRKPVDHVAPGLKISLIELQLKKLETRDAVSGRKRGSELVGLNYRHNAGICWTATRLSLKHQSRAGNPEKNHMHRSICLAALALFLPGGGASGADVINYALTSTNQFGTVDLQTGVFTQTGTLNGIVSATFVGDIDELPSGPLYGMTSDSNLVTINPVTDQVTEVGSTGNSIFGLGFRSDGTLFGISYQNLYTINTSTGAATLVGEMGNFDANGFIEARFTSSGNLELVEQNGASTSSLYNVNIATGAATLVGPTGYQLTTIDSENGTLYGFTSGGQIVTLNTATGAATLLSNEIGTTGLIYATTTIPEPASLTLLALGGVSLSALRMRNYERPRRSQRGRRRQPNRRSMNAKDARSAKE